MANTVEINVVITNRQRDRKVDTRRVREVAAAVLAETGQGAELGIHFVSAKRSAEVNWQFLQHEGPTDIITFDHGSTPERLFGEMFICVPEAVRQAAEFGTTWEAELLRYVIHGILHLRGYDDLEPAKRRVMKREENRLVRKLVTNQEGKEA
jgi:probable rRNA maturation factor